MTTPVVLTELAAVTGDADIGQHLGEAKPRLLDVVGYLLLSARDLEGAQLVRSTFSRRFRRAPRGRRGNARLILDINYLGYARCASRSNA